MNNNKGFTLMEIMTVVIIIGILVSLSIPFVIGYARDARNDRAKAVLYTVAQGYKSFRNDFPWVTIGTTGPLENINLDNQGTTCDLTGITNSGITRNWDFLIQCSYLNNIDYEGLNYHFYLGGTNLACATCNSPTAATDLACMVGNDGGDYGNAYCAYIDSNNTLIDPYMAD